MQTFRYATDTTEANRFFIFITSIDPICSLELVYLCHSFLYL